MKCTIPEISWHNRDPVLSVDIQPKTDKTTDVYRMASGGTDSHVLIWYMTINESGSINLDVAADLTRHQRAVNAVKWSPSGELLASGDDESVIFIWKQKADSEPINILDGSNDQDKEIWITLKILRGHMEDVYDLSWSPNSLFLVSGSVDNTAIIWDVHKGKSSSILNDHKGFVQGVAWDPKNQYIASLSTDRYFRIFDIHTKRVVVRTSKCTLPVPEGDELFGKKVRLFHDDTLQTFFRRLCFSPDGNLIIIPSGVTDYDGVTQPMNTTYIYSRYNLKQPAIVLPSPDQYTVAVRCCPLFFKLRPHNEDSNKPVVPLPYRMIFAVATKSSVYLYDTQQKMPFGLISNIHYTRLTDLTWSKDGRILVVSSTDGFCSLITFSDNELGEIYEDHVDLNVVENKENIVRNKRRGSTIPEDKTLATKLGSEDKPTQAENDKKPMPIAIKRKPEKAEISTKIAENDQEPKPIAIKRKPEKFDNNDKNSTKPSNETDPSPIVVKRKPTNTAKEPTPIAIKRKPSSSESTAESGSECGSQKMPTILEKMSTDIILEKAIISSDEKFESPEKKSRPVTPISVRRHPRTPNSMTPSTKDCVEKLKIATSPLSSLAKPELKKATPIAVRRQPRVLISTPVPNTDGNEQAMDAWPLESSPTNETQNSPAKQEAKSTEDTQCTEDIRLVYEESQDDQMEQVTEKPSESLGEEEKTPRRVQFKTISTPKSKKKLIN